MSWLRSAGAGRAVGGGVGCAPQQTRLVPFGIVRMSLAKVFPCLVKERPPRMTVAAAPLLIIKYFRDRQGRTVFFL